MRLALDGRDNQLQTGTFILILSASAINMSTVTKEISITITAPNPTVLNIDGPNSYEKSATSSTTLTYYVKFATPLYAN
jgi:hypothetical protein